MTGDRSATAEALPRVIRKLCRRGLRLVAFPAFSAARLAEWRRSRTRLSVGYLRPILGIPAATGMVAAAFYAPALAVAATCVAGFLVLLSLFVKVTFDWGGPPPSNGLSGSEAANLSGPASGGGW